MPFQSDAQRRWMYANHPRMAARWQKHTPKNKDLPEHVAKKSYDNLACLATQLFPQKPAESAISGSKTASVEPYAALKTISVASVSPVQAAKVATVSIPQALHAKLADIVSCSKQAAAAIPQMPDPNSAKKPGTTKADMQVINTPSAKWTRFLQQFQAPKPNTAQQLQQKVPAAPQAGQPASFQTFGAKTTADGQPTNWGNGMQRLFGQRANLGGLAAATN